MQCFLTSELHGLPFSGIKIQHGTIWVEYYVFMRRKTSQMPGQQPPTSAIHASHVASERGNGRVQIIMDGAVGWQCLDEVIINVVFWPEAMDN